MSYTVFNLVVFNESGLHAYLDHVLVCRNRFSCNHFNNIRINRVIPFGDVRNILASDLYSSFGIWSLEWGVHRQRAQLSGCTLEQSLHFEEKGGKDACPLIRSRSVNLSFMRILRVLRSYLGFFSSTVAVNILGPVNWSTGGLVRIVRLVWAYNFSVESWKMLKVFLTPDLVRFEYYAWSVNSGQIKQTSRW